MSELHSVRKILVIKLRHIGDVLLTVPTLRALRETFPAADISVLVNAGTEGVLDGNPLVDEILTLDRGIKRLPPLTRYVREMNSLGQIRKKRFDMTVDLTGGDRAAILSFTSGARYRMGWKDAGGFAGKRYLYTHLSVPGSARHMVLQNLDVVRSFGIETKDLSVSIHISEAARLFAKKSLRKHTVTGNSAIVHVHPTSRWLFKCWKDEHMAEIIEWLASQGATIIVTSSPDKRELEKTRKILSLCGDKARPSILDLCGKTTLEQLAALSETSNLFFGVDSAPMHIAAAAGTPVVSLFGPSGAFHWGPWDNAKGQGEVQSAKYLKRSGVQVSGPHTVIQREWDCIPCGRDGCSGTKMSNCLEDIRVEEVLNIIAKKLEEVEKARDERVRM